MKFGQLGAVFETCPSLIFFWADAPVAGRASAMQASAAAARMSFMAVSPCVDDLRRPDAAMLARSYHGGIFLLQNVLDIRYEADHYMAILAQRGRRPEAFLKVGARLAFPQ